jgi:2-polyprenyl-3-methyl-5-hydroxy-6-metoxy-1,4-benzoquinol methylase
MFFDHKQSAYKNKPDFYFSNARTDYVNRMPNNPNARVLEIGCGTGSTGALALKNNKCDYYVGVEINSEVATLAREKLSKVIVADVENIDLDWEESSFDILILSEVLEHLVDPWETIRKLLVFLKPSGLIMSSSPNVSHYKIIKNLILGKWELTDSGVMDRTHLRWFTPYTFRNLFEQNGVVIEKLEPMSKLGIKPSIINFLTLNYFSHLFFIQINIVGVKK